MQKWKKRIGDFKSQVQRQGFTKLRKLPETMPHQKNNSKHQDWFSKLAGEDSLRELGGTVPMQYQPNQKLLDEFVKNEVPVLRATWLLKITILNKLKHQRGSGGDHQYRKEWTVMLVDFLKRHLQNKTLQSNLERWMSRWSYVIR